MSAIEPAKGRTLDELEATIEHGKQTFIEVGLALMEVRDRRLYRDAGFPTFEKYCVGRWQFSRRHASRLVDAASTAAALADGLDDKTGPVGPVPTTERQARELAPLAREDPEEARAVWREVVEEAEDTEQPITAAKVRDAVQRARQPGVERVEGEVVEGPDPRIAGVAETIRILDDCRKARKDVYAIAFQNFTRSLRSLLKDMQNDPRIPK